MKIEPMSPGEIRIVAPARTLRFLPGDGDYEDMRVSLEPGCYVAGVGRVTEEELAERMQRFWGFEVLREREEER